MNFRDYYILSWYVRMFPKALFRHYLVFISKLMHDFTNKSFMGRTLDLGPKKLNFLGLTKHRGYAGHYRSSFCNSVFKSL